MGKVYRWLNIKELSQQAKEYIKQNAEKAFEKLEAEQQKRGL